MTRYFLVTVFLSFFILMSCAEKKEMHQTESSSVGKEKKATDSAEKVYYYTCPMESHKHIHSDKPGDCTECSMKLVAAVEAETSNAEYYGCPMASHSHIRHDKAGQCEECNMDLKPMKLKK